MPSSLPLSGLTAAVSLPPGVTANIYDARLDEEFREKDSEAFADAGFGSGVLTGQRLHGVMVGWLTENDPGLGAYHANVPISFTAATGCIITGTFNITRLRIRLRVGQISIFTAEVSSVGTYSKSWIQS